ncbi:ComF family protein [Undibacterium sp. LX40W]|uniref:ComF family protein n=1 Tax=Undibacterium nitidum TaxID=2762298 RepID=A0A923HSB0_9BURK|nr:MULTISPECIES: ComF family protein [Undibacterium]MBC3882395.1 ComF family protein [Undibacterium nitidum]MBC3892676.1 ComF family protein [Undibacterium sp. LX40W]
MNPFTYALNYLLPSRCQLCSERTEGAVCPQCAEDFIIARKSRCDQCGIQLTDADNDQKCGECLKTSPFYDFTIVGTDYVPPIDELVQRLKFGQQLPIAQLMAFTIRESIITKQDRLLPSIIAPVPLGRLRLTERGFNQSWEVVRHLSEQLGIPKQACLLSRIRETQAQSLIPLTQRSANTRGAFVCNMTFKHQILDRHVGVVDDVMTTGATLNEVAKTLKRAGATTVTNFVFARTPRRP